MKRIFSDLVGSARFLGRHAFRSPGLVVQLTAITLFWMVGAQNRALQTLHGIQARRRDISKLRQHYAKLTRQHFISCLRRSTGSPNGHYLRADLAERVQDDPQAAFAAWRRSFPARKLNAASQIWAETRQIACHLNRPRKRKVLVCSHHNWQFINPVISALERDPDLQVRTLRGDTVLAPYAMTASNLFPPLDDPISEARDMMTGLRTDQPHIAKLIDGSDTILVEWANEAAVWMARVLPADKRLVVRLHSFEAFSPWVHFVPWGRVNAIIFVGEHIRAFVNAMLNLTKRYPSLEQYVLGNWNDVTAWTTDKELHARLSLGMAGYADTRKGPLLAVEILEALIRRAPQHPWRLHLVGHPWPEKALDREEESYRDRFLARIKSSALAGRIVIDPYTDRLDMWFRRVGFILSASDHESQHMTVVQGMSSGCIPIVRNWPVGKRWNGAATVYPDALIWDEPEEAAKLILGHIEPALWEAKRREARKEAESRFDRSALYPALKAVILGRVPWRG